MPAIDDLVPRWDVHEVHAVEVSAPPERAVAGALALRVAGDPIVRALFRLRGLRTRGTIADVFAAMGFQELARGETEVVLGASGAPWRLRHPAIARFDDARPGTVRIALDFRADGRRLTTETRVVAIDSDARRAFRRYWRVVGPFSALIRRRWLARIARELERPS